MADTSKDFSAFTVKYLHRTNKISTKVKVSLPYDPNIDQESNSPDQIIECDAIWDTGASSSTITKRLASQLGLKPIGKTKVFNTTGKHIENTYLINIRLPNNVVVGYVNVTECKSLVGNFELLIGMDIISNGDFTISNVGGKTVFTFRVPSVEEIDYVKEAERIKNERRIFIPIQKASELRNSSLNRLKIKKRRAKEKIKRRTQRLSRGKK